MRPASSAGGLVLLKAGDERPRPTETVRYRRVARGVRDASVGARAGGAVPDGHHPRSAGPSHLLSNLFLEHDAEKLQRFGLGLLVGFGMVGKR
jgi:hypothetical protein